MQPVFLKLFGFLKKTCNKIDSIMKKKKTTCPVCPQPKQEFALGPAHCGG